MTAYQSVEQLAQAEIVEKKSRFIGLAAPAQTPEEAQRIIEEVREKHAAATHNVFAYVIRQPLAERYSDDGEPSGTAGVPVLDVIKKEGLTNVVVVVTRYFGGTLLGAGGLVRAYSAAAREGLHAAGIVTMTLCEELQITCAYPLWGKLQNEIARLGGTVLHTEFGEQVSVTVRVLHEKSDRLQKGIIEISNARAVIKPLEMRFCPAPE